MTHGANKESNFKRMKRTTGELNFKTSLVFIFLLIFGCGWESGQTCPM